MKVADCIVVRNHFTFVCAALVGGLGVGCSDADAVRSAATSAGAGTASETRSANGGQGGAGGNTASEVGVQGGVAGKCWEMKAWTPDGCGACAMTMDQYCADFACTADPLPTCDRLPAAYSIDEGCGLLKLRMSGHGGAIYTESVYDQQTRTLKYYFDNGGRSSGCMPVLTVGVKPTCDSWTTLCEGAGGA